MSDNVGKGNLNTKYLSCKANKEIRETGKVFVKNHSRLL